MALGLLVVFLGWALITPVGSSPDDDYHLASIWCASGIEEGLCEIDDADPGSRLVPQDVAEAFRCYAFDPAQDASCAESLTADLVPTTRVNATAGLYPEWFYRSMGIFVGEDPQASVLSMRVVNSVLAASLLLAALLLAPRGIARGIATATLIAYVPIGLYIIPSTNPSSWAITGVATFWVFGISLLARKSGEAPWRVVALTLGAVVGAAMAMASRLDASAYLVVVTVIIVLTVGLQVAWDRKVSTGLLVVLSALGLFVYATTQPPVSPGGEALGTADQGIGLLLTNALNVVIYLQEAVGGPLGWYDIFLPTWVPIIGTLAIGFVIYRQLGFGRSRVLLASVFAFGAFLAVPLMFLQLSGLVVGELIQPRYLLPLLVVFIATASLGPDVTRGRPWPPLALIAIVAALAISALLALWYTAHRFAAGSDQGLFDLDLVLRWNGITGIPWVVVIIVTASATIGYFLAAYSLLREPSADVTRPSEHEHAQR